MISLRFCTSAQTIHSYHRASARAQPAETSSTSLTSSTRSRVQGEGGPCSLDLSIAIWVWLLLLLLLPRSHGGMVLASQPLHVSYTGSTTPATGAARSSVNVMPRKKPRRPPAA